MVWSAELLIAVLASMASGVGVYSAIKADLARMHIRLDHIERDLYKPKEQYGYQKAQNRT